MIQITFVHNFVILIRYCSKVLITDTLNPEILRFHLKHNSSKDSTCELFVNDMKILHGTIASLKCHHLPTMSLYDAIEQWELDRAELKLSYNLKTQGDWVKHLTWFHCRCRASTFTLVQNVISHYVIISSNLFDNDK